MLRRFHHHVSTCSLFSSSIRFSSSLQTQIESVETAIVESEMKLRSSVADQSSPSKKKKFPFPIGILNFNAKNKIAEFDSIMAKLDSDDSGEILQDLDRHFPFASVIGEWEDSDLFQNPDKKLLVENPELLCRWLISSSHLMIGEDHVDWVCETLWTKREEMRKKIDARLALRTIAAFETWYVKESPQCFGMVPLMNSIEDAIRASSFQKDTTQLKMISPEEVADVIKTLVGLFRKRNKGDRQVPIPSLLDESLAGIVRAMARSYVFDDPLLTPTYDQFNKNWSKERQVAYLKKRNQNFEEWLAVIGRFFRVGIRRFPHTLRPILDSIFLITKEYKLESNKSDFCYSQQWPVFVFNKLQQPSHGSSTAASSLTRQFVDSLDVVINEEVSSSSFSSRVDPYWNLLFTRPLLTVLFMQVPHWPLRDVHLVSSLCTRFINSKEKEASTKKSDEEQTQRLIETAKRLLVTSLRASQSMFRELVENEKKQSFNNSNNRRGSNGKPMMTVESALCANLFLDLTKNSVPEDVLKMASIGIKTASSSKSPSSATVLGFEKRGNMIDQLEEDAQVVSSRFPHLRKT